MDELNIEHRLSILEQNGKSVNRRLENLEKLVESVHIIATETKAMRENINSIDDRVAAIEHKPQKRLDTIVTAVITAIIGACIGFIFAKIGL
jgi:tetrahydromethanopterin S-methyltransferase subunit G